MNTKTEPVAAPTVARTIAVWAGSDRNTVHLAHAIVSSVLPSMPRRLRPSGRPLCDRSTRHTPDVVEAVAQRVTCPRCQAIAGLSMAFVGTTAEVQGDEG